MTQFDNEAFAAALHIKAFKMRLGQNEAARAMGVSASTLCRIVSHRKDPDIHSLIKMLSWLEMKLEDFVS